MTAAAIALAGREGLPAVSMRRDAADLKTGPASLYRYVDSRDNLLDLMVDEVAAGYQLPAPGGPWLPGLLQVCRQGHELMLRHRWLPELVLTRSALGPHCTDLTAALTGSSLSAPSPFESTVSRVLIGLLGE
ncbi:hypothetical protein [Actinoplanes sp. NPDC051851]|uniref:TetR/AcrR family transcriptional regulator n=1 Tax=Actinoplanes sp. NPDC051851 TaxID=3154753 RepID=UPI00342C82C4